MSARKRDVAEILTWLEQRGTKRNRQGMARYAITAPKVFGVSMATMKTLAKRYGSDHELALLLWEEGWHETRILAAFMADPARLEARDMDRWARAFDNWAVCDTLCFHLFDRSAHAWAKVESWSKSNQEFVKRAAFALLAALASHDKQAPDAPFLRSLRLIERGAKDERNFVKKGVSWALRVIGQRNRKLHAAAMCTAGKLAASADVSARWVGKDALRDLSRPIVERRLLRREQANAKTR